MSQPSHIIKAVFFGDYTVGKNSIRDNYIGSPTGKGYIMSMPADFVSTDFAIDSITYKLQLWNLSGVNHPHRIQSIFYLNATAGIAVYDLTNRTSFYNIKDWIEDYWSNNQLGPVPTLIIGNKSDLQSPTSVPFEAAEQLAQNLSERTIPLGFHIKAVETNIHSVASIRAALEELWLDTVNFIKHRHGNAST